MPFRALSYPNLIFAIDLHTANTEYASTCASFCCYRSCWLCQQRGKAQPLKFKTTIEPLPNENLIGPCSFELSIRQKLPAPKDRRNVRNKG
jgi:hypothetical protein